MAANGTWSATVLAHRPQQCLLLSCRGPDAQRWRRVEAAGRPRRRPRRLHSRRHASLVCLALVALARCSSISCYNIHSRKIPSSRGFSVIESWKERAEPKCLAGRQLSGNCFGFDPLYFTPWPCGDLNLSDRMFLTETTVDAETAQPIDGTKMLVDDGCDLGVNEAVRGR